MFLIVALNCGFGRTELASVELDEVQLRQKHPHEREVGYHSTADDGWIFRMRRTSGVYGKWKLWPETVAAIDWWLQERARIEPAPGVTTLLVNRKGNRYDTPTKGNHANFQIPNSWIALTKKIQRDHVGFRSLSFNKLRKTAGVFLCHGTPVRSDGLLDCYTNRPFAKVFHAIDQVGERLRSIWRAVEVPFPERRRKGGDNITLGTIKHIESMRRQGFKVAYIAEKLGVSPETVRRRSRPRS